MGKSNEFDLNKPFKMKRRRKHLTITLTSGSSAKMRHLEISYWVIALAAAAFLCVIATVLLLQIRIADLQMFDGGYTTQTRAASRKLDEVIIEKDRLEQELSLAREQLELSTAKTETVRAQLSGYEDKLSQLLAKVDDINEYRSNVVAVLNDLQALGIPYSFDESILTTYGQPAVGGDYTGSTEDILAEIELVLDNNIHDYQEIARYITGQQLADYFRSRPAGSPIPNAERMGPGFGYRTNPFTKVGREMHNGIDISAKTGDGIYATADGVVAFSGWRSDGYGNLVIIEHAYGFRTYYAHNSRNLVKAGEEVTRGQLIARAGSTGRSTGPHLHYEVRLDGVPQNPRLYMGID